MDERRRCRWRRSLLVGITSRDPARLAAVLVLPMVGDGSQGRWWLNGSGGGSDGGYPRVASCVAMAGPIRPVEGGEARVDDSIRPGRGSCSQDRCPNPT
jgi:hypothetical protein